MSAARTTPQIPAEVAARRSPPPPALEQGDHLTREEFERRYEATPKSFKAELIEGVVYMASPVSRWHGRPHGQIQTWIGVYEAHTIGVEAYDNATTRLDLDNEPQPDACLLIQPRCGGLSKIAEEKDYIVGAAELVVEVAVSSVSYDLHEKLRAYKRNGVKEYIVWRVYDQVIDWFALTEGRYDLLAPTDGLIKSRVFPGLWLDPAALLAGDLAKVLAVLQQGIADPSHVAFVETLRAAAAAAPPARA